MLLYYAFFTLTLIPRCLCDISVEELSKLFSSKDCIPGTLSSIITNPAQDVYVKVDSDATIRQGNDAETFGLSTLHEIAVYNEIQYQYELESEEGPAHEKLFKVSLTLGDERYQGEGSSLKKAKRDAAAAAIIGTSYGKPPAKERKKYENTDSVTPVMLLNNLSAKLGIPVKYSLVEDDQGTISSLGLKSKKIYLKTLNESIYDEDLSLRKDLPQTKGPFHVKLEVLGREFYGVAHNIQVAKHEAAISALEFLVKEKDNLDLHCLKGSEEDCKTARQSMKSPISLVYEAAQARQLNVAFHLVSESGKAHRKTFTTECTLGDLKTTGEGSSKKESKRNAAESMLLEINNLEPIPLGQQVKTLADKKEKTKKKSKRNKILKKEWNNIGSAAVELFSFVSNFMNRNDDSNNKDDVGVSNKPKSKKKYGYQGKILELSNFLNVELQYMDLDGNSLLEIHVDPQQLCLGKGETKTAAREDAALKGLKLLYKMGLFEHFDGSIQSTMESDTKHSIDVIMRADPSENTK